MKPGTIPASPLGATTDQVRTNPGIGNPGLVEPAGPTDPDVMLLAATTPERSYGHDLVAETWTIRL